MEKFVLVERDVVAEDIYVDFVYEEVLDLFYIHVSVDDKTYSSVMDNNKSTSKQNYYKLSMLLCASYDAYGKKTFIIETRKYISKISVPRIYHQTENAIINSINKEKNSELLC